jgi:hypothetical protein
MTVNSGSSANLVALSALTSPKLKARQLKPGDEVITAATGFPTTVNPLLGAGLVPVFVDMLPTTYNFDPDKVAAAIGPKTKAIMAAHTLGNPFDLAAIRKLCDDHGLWLIEDCCDALGSTYDGRQVGRSATSPRSASIPPTTSPPAKAGRCSPTTSSCAAWRSRSATGAATASARRAWTTPAASGSAGRWATCRAATTTSTPTGTSAIISR